MNTDKRKTAEDFLEEHCGSLPAWADNRKIAVLKAMQAHIDYINNAPARTDVLDEIVAESEKEYQPAGQLMTSAEARGLRHAYQKGAYFGYSLNSGSKNAIAFATFSDICMDEGGMSWSVVMERVPKTFTSIKELYAFFCENIEEIDRAFELSAD